MSYLKFPRNIIGFLLLLFTFFISGSSFGQQYINDYSKWNSVRPYRAKTLYVVLHMTEASDGSSIRSIKRSGTANYVVMTNGTIYSVISEKKIAKHAGRSIWQNHLNLSEISVGIEIVGKHNKPLTAQQFIALRGLIAKLKKTYRLSDNKIVTHSMVAFGSPNKWFPFKHRGRKRCAMLLATKSVRQKLGLKNTFKADPDVQARRLKVADPYLCKVLYGSYVPAEKEKEDKVKGITEGKTDDDEAFEGFQEVSKEDIRSKEYRSSTTIYFFADGRIRTGKEVSTKEFATFPKKTKALIGYVYGGKISKSRTAYSVVGKKWDSPSTFYYFPDGKTHTGDEVDGNVLPIGTIVLFRK